MVKKGVSNLLNKICAKRNFIAGLHIFLTISFISYFFIPSRICSICSIIIFLILSRLTYLKGKEVTKLALKYNDSEQLLTEIFKSVPDLIFYKDCDLRYISCNDAFLDAICLKKEDVLGKSDFEVLEESVAQEFAHYDMQVINTKEVVIYDQKIDKDGEIKIYNLIKSPIFSIEGEVTGILGIARDITVQKKLQKAFNEKQSQLSAILENMPFFAYMKDINGNFVCGNKKVTEFFGKRPEDLVNLPVSNIFFDDYDEISKEDKELIRIKEPLRNERILNTIKGSIWMEVHKAPIFDENGEVIGIVVVTKDIELQKKIEQQKENFVATLSHDIRTPAMAQIRALDVVLKGSLGEINEQQKEAIEQVRNSCSYIFNMISTLLTTYKYEDGIKKMEYDEFHFEALVSECCNEIAYLIEEKQQKIVIKNDYTNQVVNADKLEIKRVVTNLISNAISYSAENTEIEIIISGDSETLYFAVKNYSEYIPQKELDKLFSKFVSDASKFKKLGFGLGLYLVKQIIKTHNGEVFAKSCETEGNTFGFKIPVKANLAQKCIESIEKN